MNTACKGSASSVELQGHKTSSDCSEKNTKEKSTWISSASCDLEHWSSKKLAATPQNPISKLIENLQVNLINVKKISVHIWIIIFSVLLIKFWIRKKESEASIKKGV